MRTTFSWELTCCIDNNLACNKPLSKAGIYHKGIGLRNNEGGRGRLPPCCHSMENLSDIHYLNIFVNYDDNLNGRTCCCNLSGRYPFTAGNNPFDFWRAHAEAGVDAVSIGRLTHSAPALDLSLDLGLADDGKDADR